MKIFIFLILALLSNPVEAMVMRGAASHPVIAPTITIPAGAYAFYSVMRASGYAGNAVRIQRSSDNAQIDIGWNASNYIDMATANAWAGASNITLVTWYDETNQGHDCTVGASAVQSSAPPILRSGNAYGSVQPITMESTSGFAGNAFCNLPAGSSLSSQSFTMSVVESINVGLYNSAGQFGLGSDTGTLFNNLVVYYTDNQQGTLSWVTGSAFNVPSNYPYTSNPIVVTLRGTAVPTSIMRINGTNTTSTHNTAATYVSGQLGSTNWTAAASSQADFFAAAVYATSLSDVNVALIETAAQSAFNFTMTPTDAITWNGDSITAGYTCSLFLQNLERQTQSLLSQKVGNYNIGVNGQSMQAILANTGFADAHYNAGLTNNIYHIFAGTNDLDGRASGTIVGYGTTIYNSYLLPDIQARQTKGFKVVAATMLPRAWSGSALDKSQKETERLAYNSLITGNAVADSYSVADYASLFPTASVYTSTGSCDGTHPTMATFGLMAPIAAAAINPLL